MSYPVYPDIKSFELAIGDKTITVEIGTFSQQAAAAVLARCGDTVVHTTVTLGRQVNLGFFPLSVEFVEKLYAGGIIKGSRWVKRDGRPSDEAILKARLIDRTMRPMFAKGITNEVQIVNTVFSYDGENEPDMLGLVASGLGLSLSGLPFTGPVAGLRLGYSKDSGEFVFNPTEEQREQSDLDLIVSGTSDSIVMVEAGANEVPEDVIVEALSQAQQQLQAMTAVMDTIVAEHGRDAVELVETSSDIEAARAEVKTQLETKHAQTIQQMVKAQANLEKPDLDVLVDQIELAEDGPLTASDVKNVSYEVMEAAARRMILEEGTRPDGRQLDEIRQIWTEVDVFPRTHGSAMFKRGATQAVTIATLGSPSLGQHIEDMGGEEVRHYMHHYYMPPYAAGETGRMGWPKRREVGHGALAERALLPMIPDQIDFPYTIHLVSEILSSNGSTSQAAICGSTMSLMAAGVPIKKPVAGIAMGLVSDGQRHVVLSDIQGLEDHLGDMDFKVAGTRDGITALQMDIKLQGLPREVLVQALEKSRTGRLSILDKMLETIAEPRAELSPYAPKIEQIEIPVDRIGELIGPGGKVIKNIIADTGADIDVDEDDERQVGVVNISAQDQDKIDAARTFIENMLKAVEVDEEYEGTVTRVEGFGAFVEFLPGREGLVHVSNMSTEYVKDAHDQVKVGDELHVRVKEIKDDGKIGLTLLSHQQEEEAKSNAASRPPFRGGRRGGGPGGPGGRGGRGGAPRRRQGPRFDRSDRDRGDRSGHDRGGYDRGDRNNRGDKGGRDRDRGDRGFDRGNRRGGNWDSDRDNRDSDRGGRGGSYRGQDRGRDQNRDRGRGRPNFRHDGDDQD